MAPTTRASLHATSIRRMNFARINGAAGNRAYIYVALSAPRTVCQFQTKGRKREREKEILLKREY